MRQKSDYPRDTVPCLLDPLIKLSTVKRANKIWFLYNCSTTSCASNWYCPPISRQILPLFMTSAVKPIWRVRRERNVISSLWHLWRVFRLRLCLSFLLDTPSQSTTAREGIEGNPHIKQMRHRHIFICILSCNRLVLNRFQISKLPTSGSLNQTLIKFHRESPWFISFILDWL